MFLAPFRTKRTIGMEPLGMPSLVDFRDDMNRMFEGLLNRTALPALWQDGQERAEWLPAIDVSESETSIQVRAELPGIDPADVDVSVSEDRLVISGERKSAKTTTGNGVTHREIRCGAFSRSIPLPEPVDPVRVSATYDKGVLTIDLAKSATGTSRKIPIKAT